MFTLCGNLTVNYAGKKRIIYNYKPRNYIKNTRTHPASLVILQLFVLLSILAAHSECVPFNGNPPGDVKFKCRTSKMF